jgi:ATP-binding cassette subfamily F protein 3
LLDEPTNHLDMESVDSLLEAIDTSKGAVVIVTHSEMILHAIATRLVVFDNGGVNVFEGTYQDFLDRGGWKDEGEAAAADAENPDKKGSIANRKDLKRIKAELIDNRSRVLGPLQSRISEVEESIIHMEKRIEQDTQALIGASVKGDWESIKKLSKSIHGSRVEIDILFDELETLTTELEAKSQDFGEKLEAVQRQQGAEIQKS